MYADTTRLSISNTSEDLPQKVAIELLLLIYNNNNNNNYNYINK
jgi:hypothetical protein